jgi:hypothetical protein
MFREGFRGTGSKERVFEPREHAVMSLKLKKLSKQRLNHSKNEDEPFETPVLGRRSFQPPRNSGKIAY